MSKLIPLQPGVIAEMHSTFDGGNITVPLAKGVNLEELLTGDDDPMFVTIDALSDTVSGNKRRWTSDELHRVAKQVMETKPDGYQGHLRQEDRSSKAPDAVTMWLGAKVTNHKGKNRLFVKGYVLPKASQFKDYLRRAGAAGKNVAVSVYGQAFEKWNESLKAFEIENFQLESIDWARPGAEGVPNSGYLKITAEMKEEGDEMTKEEALKSATAAELREHAPAIVQEIEEGARTELQSTVSEMVTITGVSAEADLKKTVQEMSDENKTLKTQVAQSEIDKVLGNKVTNVAARSALRKEVISEMNGSTDLTVIQETVDRVLESEEGKALVEAFKVPVVTPGSNDNRETPSGSRFIKK